MTISENMNNCKIWEDDHAVICEAVALVRRSFQKVYFLRYETEDGIDESLILNPDTYGLPTSHLTFDLWKEQIDWYDCITEDFIVHGAILLDHVDRSIGDHCGTVININSGVLHFQKSNIKMLELPNCWAKGREYLFDEAAEAILDYEDYYHEEDDAIIIVQYDRFTDEFAVLCWIKEEEE